MIEQLKVIMEAHEAQKNHNKNKKSLKTAT